MSAISVTIHKFDFELILIISLKIKERLFNNNTYYFTISNIFLKQFDKNTLKWYN